MHYRQRGVVVPTPYGHCQVLLFRENDQMVIVQLPFGKPKARMYIPLPVVMQKERAIAAATTVAMEAEEHNIHQFYMKERASCDAETRLMAEDERVLKDKLAFDAEVRQIAANASRFTSWFDFDNLHSKQKNHAQNGVLETPLPTAIGDDLTTPEPAAFAKRESVVALTHRTTSRLVSCSARFCRLLLLPLRTSL
jgi:hypothetical protein